MPVQNQISSPLRESLIQCWMEACAHEEGFYVTEAQAKARKMAWPTIAQKNNNPLNLRTWGSHPIRNGYVHFLPDVQLGAPLPKTHAGWKAAYTQSMRAIFEKKFMAGGKPTRGLTLFEIYAGQRDAAGNVVKGGYSGWAPSKDSNNPKAYAEFVLNYLRANWDPFTTFPGAAQFTINSVAESLAYTR